MLDRTFQLVLRAVCGAYAVVCFLAVAGCTLPPPAGLPKEFSVAAQQIATSVSDQALWREIAANVDGSVIEPGYEVYAGLLYKAGAKIRGFSGHVGASAVGESSGALTPEARTAILGILNGDESYREFLLELVGMASDQTPTTQPAANGP